MELLTANYLNCNPQESAKANMKDSQILDPALETIVSGKEDGEKHYHHRESDLGALVKT